MGLTSLYYGDFVFDGVDIKKRLTFDRHDVQWCIYHLGFNADMDHFHVTKWYPNECMCVKMNDSKMQKVTKKSAQKAM